MSQFSVPATASINAVSLNVAAREISTSLNSLEDIVNAAEASAVFNGKPSVDFCQYWNKDLGTFICHGHAMVKAPRAALDTSIDWFFRADDNNKLSQPWYPAFLQGVSEPSDVKIADPRVKEQRLFSSSFDFGLKRQSHYRQLACLAELDEHRKVISLRSVSDRDLNGMRYAYTLAPTGDVFSWDEEQELLHWHHICSVTGVGALPGPLDRWVMNILRALKRNHAERASYREEGSNWCALIAEAFPAQADSK